MVCPICEERVALTPRSLERHLNIEPHVIGLIEELYPHWVNQDGTSPRSVKFYRGMLRQQWERPDFLRYYKKDLPKRFP